MRIVQQVGGNEVTEDARIGAPRQITIDTDTYSIRVHDGVTPGGHKILNENQFTALNFREFLGLGAFSVPATPMTAELAESNLCQFSVAGTYTLPALSAISLVGIPILLKATVAAVIVQRAGADVISDLGADVNSLALTQHEIVKIVKQDTARWLVVNRY